MQQPNPLPNIDGLGNADAFELIAKLIDQSTSEIKAALADHALALLDALEKRSVTPLEQAILEYFRANAWHAHQKKRRADKNAVWDFDLPELRKQLYHFRRAANSAGFAELDAFQQCQILTNLGNTLHHLGRFVDAIPYWDRALSIDPSFWMARGARGDALRTYAQVLYDATDNAIFAHYVHGDLTLAARQGANSDDPQDIPIVANFRRQVERIESVANLQAISEIVEEPEQPVGKTKAERAYRQWVRIHSLFLNPLNDVERKSLPRVACDSLWLPSFVTKIGSPPIVAGMFNELKQGFISARYLYWEGAESTAPHFSDRDAPLFSTMDYTSHGLAVEKVKIAFRVAYSLFDKIAYFLNHYLALNIPEKQVSFRKLWRENNGSVKMAFDQSENWPLRGLFWLGEDLFAKDFDHIEPDVRALDELRNHLEHKYVKIHEFKPAHADPADPFFDSLAHSIDRREFEQKTLRLLKLSRAALIYLVLAMHREEVKRKKSSTGLAAPMSLSMIEDDWKR